MSGSALKDAIQHYIEHPRPQAAIDSLLGHMAQIASEKPRISECLIEPRVIYELIVVMTEALFGQGSELTKEIVSNLIVINTPEIQTLASYTFNRHTGAKTLTINCVLINKSLEDIAHLGNLQLANQQFRDAMSPYTKIILVIEHEYIHLLVEIAGIQKKNEDKHGIEFVTLSRSLFGQGWGDLSFTHIGDYMSVSGDKDAFTQLLKTKAKSLTDEYINRVYDILLRQFGKGALEPAVGGKHRRKQKHKHTRKSRRASLYRK